MTTGLPLGGCRRRYSGTVYHFFLDSGLSMGVPMRVLARREVLGSAAGVAGLAVFGLAKAAELPPTPAQTPGPFYPPVLPADAGADLVHATGVARGVLTQVSGRILDHTGRPLAGAGVEIWQCDANGRYHNVDDGRREPPLDASFKGYGRVVTDEAGGYRFLTIRPVPYPGRTPHIHFAVSAPGGARFVTQMYVAGEKLNERDGLYRSLRDPAPVTVPLQPVAQRREYALEGNFDIVLGA
jgi:protocatechuate 3,4-dioxygenase beta subunit